MTEKRKKASGNPKKMGTNTKISAAIYIGSYTIQMLIARISSEKNGFEVVNEYTSYSKLTDPVQPDRLSREGMDQSLKVLREMRGIALERNVSEIRICTSSAIRTKVNRSQFLLECSGIFGILPQILSGRDEARLDYIGAMTDAFSTLPMIAVRIGFNSCQIAYGTSEKIVKALSLDFGIGELNEKFGLNERKIGFFKQIALHDYIRGKFLPASEEYQTWKKSLSLDPEMMAIGSVPFACLKFLNGSGIPDDHTAVSAVPPTSDSIAELCRKLLSLNRNGLQALPGIDPEIKPAILGGISILRGILEFAGVYDFRATPYGLCAGILKSPAAVFSTAELSPSAQNQF